MSQTGPKQHNDTEFQFYQRNEGESLTISTALLKLARCDVTDATMFYMDLTDTGNYSTDIVEDMACLDRFVENIKPDKKFYLRQLPILMSMTDKEPRFFLEEVVEIASLLLRRSPNSHKELPEKTVLDSSSDEIVPKVMTLTEVKTLFEDCDIDKGLVTITPDVEYSIISKSSLQYNQQLYITDRRGKRFVYPTIAVYKIFKECVLENNWATNICIRHLNCMENCRKKVIELMKKYTGSSMNLIPFETVQMEIEKLKREDCYLDPQKECSELMNYLFYELPKDDIALLDTYKEVINYFHLPTNGPLAELHHAPVQGIKLSFLIGWIIQFIGPIDKDNEILANVLVSNLEFSIEKDIEETVAFIRDEVIVRGKEGTRKIFKPYGAQEDTRIQSKYEKMTEKARLRKQAVEQKKNKKGGKQKSAKEIEEKHGAPEGQWKDLSDESFEFSRPTSTEDIRLSTVIISGHRYGSNYSLLENGPRKENPQKFFFIDIDELEKLMDMGSVMGFEWIKDEEYLEDLGTFVTMTGIKKFVIRRLQEDILGSGRFLQFEEAVEIASISLKLKGDDPNKHGMLEFLKADIQGLNEHVRRSRSMNGMEALFSMNKIDKSTITVIPDFVEKLSEIHSNENIYTPVTTIGRKGEDLMNMGESALYIFKNVICGVNWTKAIEVHGTDVYHNFQTILEDTLKPIFCEWETCYVAKDWHEDTINNLKNHKIFENQSRTDLNFFEGFSKGSLVPTSYFSDQCEANGLPPMPGMPLPDEMLVDEAKVLMMVVWACQFYPHQERSREQGDRAMQRGVIMNTMSARLPEEAKLHNHLENLITHWSKPGRMQSQPAAGEEVRKQVIRLRETFLNAPTLLPSEMSAEESVNTFDTLFGNLMSSTGKALKAFESQLESLEKTEKVQEPKKEIKDNSKESFSKSKKPQEGSTKKSKLKASAISKESSRSSSTSTSEACSSQTPVPDGLEKNHGLLDEKTIDRNKKQRKEKKNAKAVETHETSAESGAESKDAPAKVLDSSQPVLEDAKSSSGKIPKPSKLREGSLDKTEKAKGPEKEVQANSKKAPSKQPKGIPESAKNDGPGSSPSRQGKSKTSAISKESSRSPSTSISEPCPSQNPIPEGEILKKIRSGFDGETLMKKKFPILDNNDYRVVSNDYMEKIEHQIKGLMVQIKNSYLKKTRR